jgi:GTPase SAR1 family protein
MPKPSSKFDWPKVGEDIQQAAPIFAAIAVIVAAADAAYNFLKKIVNDIRPKGKGEQPKEEEPTMNSKQQKPPQAPPAPQLEVTIQILGAQGVGKTTLWERLSGESAISGPPPKTDGTIHCQPFIYSDESPEFPPIRFLKPCDVGGDKQYQTKDWQDILGQMKPDALIVVIDHTPIDRHREALLAIQKVFNENPDVRTKCKAVLMLVNKSDCWGPDIDREWAKLKYKLHLADKNTVLQERFREIVSNYGDIRRGFMGGTVFITPRPCCALLDPLDPQIRVGLRQLLRKVILDEFKLARLQSDQS